MQALVRCNQYCHLCIAPFNDRNLYTTEVLFSSPWAQSTEGVSPFIQIKLISASVSSVDTGLCDFPHAHIYQHPTPRISLLRQHFSTLKLKLRPTAWITLWRLIITIWIKHSLPVFSLNLDHKFFWARYKPASDSQEDKRIKIATSLVHIMHTQKISEHTVLKLCRLFILPLDVPLSLL